MRQNKFTPIIAHAAGWIFFFSLVLGFLYNSTEIESPFTIVFSFAFFVFGAAYLFLFYLNTYVLIPNLYLQKKFWLYGLVITILFLVFYYVKPFDGLMTQFVTRGGPKMRPPPEIEFRPAGPFNTDNGPAEPPKGGSGPGHTDIVSIILFITGWSLSTALCIIRQWRVTEKRAIQAEADKANAELSFLKAQINPHFLFNTLNNIYSLAVSKNENTAESIMKLSNIMRYVTDDVRQDFVSLENEVACMKDYIDLQRMRLGKNMNVYFTVAGTTGNKKIAPLILMTFIENVFKYGVSSHEPCDIIIKIAADDHNIHFFCQNKLLDVKLNTERTGIGIANARQRLEYLYPGMYILDI